MEWGGISADERAFKRKMTHKYTTDPGRENCLLLRFSFEPPPPLLFSSLSISYFAMRRVTKLFNRQQVPTNLLLVAFACKSRRSVMVWPDLSRIFRVERGGTHSVTFNQE